MIKKLLALLVASTMVFLVMGCGNDEDNEDDDAVLTEMEPIEVTITVPGDVSVSTTADDWTYFSFRTGVVVSASQKNTTNWDIRFLGTKMGTNSGETAAEVGSGGNGGVMVLQESDLTSINQASVGGYVTDVRAAIATMADPKPVVSISPLMTKEDSDDPNYDENHWYTGHGGDMGPDSTKCYLIKCGDGNYARVQFTDYLKDGDDRLYTISYNYTDQPDGRFVQ